MSNCWGATIHSHRGAVVRTVVLGTVIVLAVLEASATRRYLTHWRNTEALYEHMLSLAPRSTVLHVNLGMILLKEGRTDDAIGHLEQAVLLNPSLCQAHTRLASALVARGQFDEAIAQCAESLRLEPGDYDACTTAAEALEGKGQFENAIAWYGRALDLRPDYVFALNNLAWLLATRATHDSADSRRAVALAEAACEGTAHHDPSALDTLAAAYAAVNRFADAAATAGRAAELASSANRANLAQDIRERQRLYLARRSYRAPIGAKPVTGPSP
jgi:tetratricopeptide (TPR) repeat protein